MIHKIHLDHSSLTTVTSTGKLHATQPCRGGDFPTGDMVDMSIHGMIVYICRHEWLIFFMVNVGKYTSPMDGMGYSISTVYIIYTVAVLKYNEYKMECAGVFNGYQSHESYGIVINVAQIHQEPPENMFTSRNFTKMTPLFFAKRYQNYKAHQI